MIVSTTSSSHVSQYNTLGKKLIIVPFLIQVFIQQGLQHVSIISMAFIKILQRHRIILAGQILSKTQLIITPRSPMVRWITERSQYLVLPVQYCGTAFRKAKYS